VPKQKALLVFRFDVALHGISNAHAITVAHDVIDRSEAQRKILLLQWRELRLLKMRA
jgi:hypothetical protein